MWNDLELLHLAEEQGLGRIPPRLVFGKGAVVNGWFQPYMTLSDYTTADFLCDPHQVTPVTVRFSAMTGRGGSGETNRDIRAMEVKLYTREGNCDMISLSIPEGMCCTGRDFFRLCDDLKPSKTTGLRDQCGYLRYAAEHPRALSGLLRLYGRRGIPAGYDVMESWSAGTVVWRNEAGERFLVRHRWVPEEAPRFLTENEGEFLCGFDPDNHSRKLYNRLAEGKTVKYELRLQVVPVELENGSEWNREREDALEELCDPSLTWPEDLGITVRAGRLRLDEVPEQPALTEQLFCSSTDALVSGMELLEGSFDHQMALAISALQSARLGTLRKTAAVNQHRRRQRPAMVAAVGPVSVRPDGEVRLDTDEDRYYAQAKNLWRGSAEEEKQKTAQAIAQRLVFGSDDLRVNLLKQAQLVDPEVRNFIEIQLAF